MADGDVRAGLLEAGERVFAARGYAAATVDDVIRSSGTSRASFYRYFNGKEQLFEELSRACFREMREAVRGLRYVGPAPGDRDMIEDLLGRYHDLNDRYSGVIRAWTELTGAADSPLHDSGKAAVRAMFDEMQAVLDRCGFGSVGASAAEDRTRAALLFLLIERSSFYVSNQVSRVDPDRLLPTLATMVQRGYFGGEP